jgi:glycosyltransferase involved in cell wall biosynthesis
LKVPVVSTFHVQAEHLLHNEGLYNRALVRWTYRFFLSKTYNRSDNVVCPSPFAEGELRRYGLRVPSTVISNGVPPEYRPLPRDQVQQFEGKFVILSVGRLARRSGTTSSWRPFVPRGTESDQLVILGDGRSGPSRQGKTLTYAGPKYLKPKGSSLLRGGPTSAFAADV